MKYHPGGTDELMKGAGMIATDLFNKVHPWVNITSMMEKCLVGTLIAPPVMPPPSLQQTILHNKDSLKPASLSPAKLPLLVPSTQEEISLKKIEEIGGSTVIPVTVTVAPAIPEIPVIDSYQSNTNCIIVFYTKLKSLRKESIIIDKKNNNNTFILFLYTPDAVYKYELGEEFF